MTRVGFMAAETVDGYHEIQVEVFFKQALVFYQVELLCKDVFTALCGPVLTNPALAFCGLSLCSVTQESLRLHFRFAALPDNWEPTLHRRVHAVWYTFACLDQYYPLGSVPFPPTFRRWLVEIWNEVDSPDFA